MSLASGYGIIVEVVVFSNTYAPNIWALNPLNPKNNLNDVEEIEWPDYMTLRHPKLAYEWSSSAEFWNPQFEYARNRLALLDWLIDQTAPTN